MIRYKCECGKVYQLAEEKAGRKMKCPACGAVGRAADAPEAGTSPGQAQGVVRFSCECGRRYRAAICLAGSVVKCTNCGRQLRVPQAVPPPLPGGDAEAKPSVRWWGAHGWTLTPLFVGVVAAVATELVRLATDPVARGRGYTVAVWVLFPALRLGAYSLILGVPCLLVALCARSRRFGYRTFAWLLCSAGLLDLSMTAATAYALRRRGGPGDREAARELTSEMHHVWQDVKSGRLDAFEGIDPARHGRWTRLAEVMKWYGAQAKVGHDRLAREHGFITPSQVLTPQWLGNSAALEDMQQRLARGEAAWATHPAWTQRIYDEYTTRLQVAAASDSAYAGGLRGVQRDRTEFLAAVRRESKAMCNYFSALRSLLRFLEENHGDYTCAKGQVLFASQEQCDEYNMWVKRAEAFLAQFRQVRLAIKQRVEHGLSKVDELTH